MIAVSYIMKRKIKKIFFEVISNSKIFNIIFLAKLSTTKIFPNLQGLDNVEYGIYDFFLRVIYGQSNFHTLTLDR